MMTRSLFPLLLVTLLGAGQAWAASDREATFQDPASLQSGASENLNDDHAKDMGKDDLNRHHGRDERAIEKHERVEEQDELAEDRDRQGDRMERTEHREGHERSEGADRHERAEHAERR